jgi:hypothetical protein
MPLSYVLAAIVVKVAREVGPGEERQDLLDVLADHLVGAFSMAQDVGSTPGPETANSTSLTEVSTPTIEL